MAFPSRLGLGALCATAAFGAIVAATTAAPAPAPSLRAATGAPAIAAGQALARATWGVDACGGNVRISWKRMAPEINAISTWASPTADPYADPAGNTDCAIELNPAARFDHAKLCTVVVHELGHLAGQDHDARPGTLMSEIYTTPLPGCAAPAPAPAPRRATLR